MSQRHDPDLGSVESSSPRPAPLAPSETSDRRTDVQAFFAPLFAGSGGVDSWLVADTAPQILDRLTDIETLHLSRSQFGQLLVRGHEVAPSEGFYRFYWKRLPAHAYSIRSLAAFDSAWLSGNDIVSLEHLKWGFLRFYVDALLFFGNIRTAYRELRDVSEQDLLDFFSRRSVDTKGMVERGPSLPLKPIAKDDRYLIAEVACQSLDGRLNSAAYAAIRGAYEEHVRQGGRHLVSLVELLSGEFVTSKYGTQQQQFKLATDDLLTTEIGSIEELNEIFEQHSDVFERARTAALENTRLYLSMVDELDVYVATSMRIRQDFRDMGSFCEAVFGDKRLRAMNLRYFDPTLSAANGHVDKGLIECLMVKAAKVLVYFAGTNDSFGKDVEAAMALSQGKPVIFFCDDEQREQFYRDVHPLARLIQFDTGVPVGAMVTSSIDEVAELLNRIFRNEMEYDLLQDPPGYLLLKERITGSTVRLQTNDVMLRETFWNYYHLPR